MNEKLAALERLLNIMDELREKCPWDRKQTLESLRNLTIEETYELADAILENNPEEIKKELGDLLLHIVFYSKIGSETNSFDIKSVADAISEKLIFRHPHVFGTVDVNDDDEIVKGKLGGTEDTGRKSFGAGRCSPVFTCHDQSKPHAGKG